MLNAVIHHELLKPSNTITGDFYRQQIVQMDRALKDKDRNMQRHKKMIFQYDTTRLRVGNTVKKTLPHPLHSIDISPLDYYLFGSI